MSLAYKLEKMARLGWDDDDVDVDDEDEDDDEGDGDIEAKAESFLMEPSVTFVSPNSGLNKKGGTNFP